MRMWRERATRINPSAERGAKAMDGSRKRRREELADALDQLRGFICMDTDFVR